MRSFLIVIRSIFRAIRSASFSTIPIHTPPRECHTVYAANSRRRSASGVAAEDWIALPGTPGPPWRGRWVRRRQLRGRTPLVLIRNPVWRGLVRGICPGWMARGRRYTACQAKPQGIRYRSFSEVTGCGPDGVYVSRSSLRAVHASAAP
jgi:hypothetical protein